MKRIIILLVAVLFACRIFANEPGWTEKGRKSKRDIVIEGEVQKVNKLHELKNYKWTEIWSANIKVLVVHKGAKELNGQTISVLFERGTIIEGTKIRNERCPDYAELSKGDKAKFYIVKCTKGHLKRLEMNKETKNALLIQMGSDVVKSIKKRKSRY